MKGTDNNAPPHPHTQERREREREREEAIALAHIAASHHVEMQRHQSVMMSKQKKTDEKKYSS